MFTTQTRMAWKADRYSTIAAAIAAGISLGVAFDVSDASGAIVWAWEMRL